MASLVAAAVAPAEAGEPVRRAIGRAGCALVGIAEAEVLVWAPTWMDAEGLAELLPGAPCLRWVHLAWTGTERFEPMIEARPDLRWSCGRGGFGDLLAEHALALGVGGLRGVPGYTRARRWGEPTSRSLLDGNVTILGGGSTAEALLRLLQPFRATCTVVRRQEVDMEGAARVLRPAQLEAALEGADLVVSALPHTPQTQGIIGARELERMEPHAWLVNVGRGSAIVTDDLIVALRSGSIGGAALDVTDPEPLPDGHPLWNLPNCVITPHTANTVELGWGRVADRVEENLRRYGSGAPLLGEISSPSP